MIQTSPKVAEAVARGALAGVVLGVLGTALPASAQQTDIEALRAQIKVLQDRLDKIEADAKKAAAAPQGTPLTAKEKVTLSGALQVQGYGYFSEQNNEPRTASTFRLRRGELRLTGQVTPRVSGTIQIDPAKQLSNNAVTVPAGGGTVTPAPNQANNILQEIQVSYLLRKDEKSTHYFDIGQTKLPLGFEGDLISSPTLQVIDRALLFRARDPFRGGYGDIRDNGANLRGTIGQFDYKVGVYNGLGERQNTTAASSPKAYIGRVVYKPAGVPGLQVGLSAAHGNTGNTAGGPRTDRSVYNAFAQLKRDKLTLQGEYLRGDSQLQNATSIRDVDGYYAHVAYLFRPSLEGVLRYDTFDFNRHASGADVKEITLGLNYYLKGNNAKIQANLVRFEGDPTAPAGASPSWRNDRTELRTQFQVGF